MSSTIPRLVGLGRISRVAEQARRSKLVSNVPSWFLLQFLLPGFCLELPPWLLQMVDCKLGQEFIRMAEKRARTNVSGSNF